MRAGSAREALGAPWCGGAALARVCLDAASGSGLLPLPGRSSALPPPLPLGSLHQAYQVFKARASGADAILLIAAVLPNKDMNYLIKAARSVGLQCLIEVRRRLDGPGASACTAAASTPAMLCRAILCSSVAALATRRAARSRCRAFMLR